MQYHFEEFGKYAEITGYDRIPFASAEAFLKANRKQTQTVEIQFFDASLIATKEHLYFATLNALQAFKGKTNLSKSLAMETMLYASAQRQIQKAIEKCGIKPHTTSMAVVLIGENKEQIQTAFKELNACLGIKPNEAVLELTESKMAKIKAAFGITEAELTVVSDKDAEKAVANLVIERMALLATQL